MENNLKIWRTRCTKNKYVTKEWKKRANIGKIILKVQRIRLGRNKYITKKRKYLYEENNED